MQIEEVKIKKLVASEGKIIVSKDTYINKETGKEEYKVQGKIIYLGKNDDIKNYKEIDEVFE